MASTKASHIEFETYTPVSHKGKGLDRAPGYDPRQALVTPGLSPNPPSFRDERDARLSGQGIHGGATSFPDEMLGGVRSNIRSYARGIHVGERLNPSEYLWPDDFNPNTSLELEAQGLKYAPPDTAHPQILPGPNSVPGEGVAVIDPSRQGLLRNLVPTWH